MFENFNQPIDLYCERLSTAFWAEPVNALTNLAFILAAAFGYSLYKKSARKSRDIIVLISLTALVGIGSFIFHTVATHGAMLADVIPIGIFIIVTIYVIFTRVFQLKSWHAVTGVIAFLAFNAIILNIFGRTFLNGSIQYIPTFLLLLIVAIYCRIKHYIPAKEFFLAAFIFLISLICRSIDAQICPNFPLGTHFLWHILNGATMYYVIKGLIKSIGKTNSA